MAHFVRDHNRIHEESGERYHERGERQIRDYLEYFDLRVGYLLSFDFRRDKEPGVERVAFGDAVLFEGTV